LREVSPEARYQGRQAQAVPLLDKLREWLDQTLPQASPKSLTGEALGYLHSQWQKLIRYLDDGRLEIDNNLVENAIRPLRRSGAITGSSQIRSAGPWRAHACIA